jgi:hypothetical protein
VTATGDGTTAAEEVFITVAFIVARGLLWEGREVGVKSRRKNAGQQILEAFR